MVFSGLDEGLNQTYHTLGRSKESGISKKPDSLREPIYHKTDVPPYKTYRIMSNTCFTTYKVVSEKKKDITKLYKTLQRMTKRKTPIVPNRWYDAKLWLGCLVKALGGDPDKIYCRGTITHFEMEDGILSIDTETAWAEMEETMHFIESCFPGMKIYYIEEESGCERFYINDNEGIYFKSRYYLDGFEESEYFETLDEAAKYVKEIVGHEVEATFKAIEAALNKYMEEHEEEDDMYYYFHKFHVVND